MESVEEEEGNGPAEDLCRTSDRANSKSVLAFGRQRRSEHLDTGDETAQGTADLIMEERSNRQLQWLKLRGKLEMAMPTHAHVAAANGVGALFPAKYSCREDR
jgi:hypothetical protein